MAATHQAPSRAHRRPVRLRCRGQAAGLRCDGDFNTGAYASWGPTVANRVPVHAMGPYAVPNVRTWGEAFFTNGPPAGAFRGFGVPQAAIAHEAMMDELADRLRHGPAGVPPSATRCVPATPRRRARCWRTPPASPQCLEALRPHWQQGAGRGRGLQCATAGRRRRGVGIGCMWYGIGNTSMSNPSRMRVGLSPAGTLTLYSGAVDIGQGSNTIMTQIAADALGVPAAQFALVAGDTDLTADAGKTSASRQTFVSGMAAERAGRGSAPADPAPGQCRRRRPSCRSSGAELHGARRRRGRAPSTWRAPAR